MDPDYKQQIKKLALDLRNLFEDDLAVVLKRYGIFTNRAWLPVHEIPKADDEILHTRQRLEAAMHPNLERGVKRPEAARLYVREAGFTYLNRLVGLKVLEVRDLFPETIQTRPEYGGRSLYQRDFRAAHPERATAADDALLAALEAACRDVSQHIRFVFDIESESSILWPRYAALKEAIQRINTLPVQVWQEDEIIGWIYQFYNAEEKKAVRKRGKPKLPIEVAVINQFFTPRWIVKYLVDNTLGRLWLEMHPDSQRVRAKCDYLVPEPLGVPDDRQEEGKIQLDPDSPVNNPSAAPRREPKRPQDIRLIDPACGTMHFGHYAFEVFQEIYRDAREQGWVEAEGALEDRDIPLSILKHNLYGVDIDLRAVQLAALSLYVKARTSQREAGMADGEAARLLWSVNLVCADARLTNGGMRERFLSAYADDPVLVRAWKELFREMEDIGQVGSLLRVEERFRQILREYKPPTVAGLQQPHQESLPGVPTRPRQMSFGETPTSNGWSASRTLSKMLKELGGFARQSLIDHDVTAQTFVSETAKTLNLLDIFVQKYDVLVMNPPYGATTSSGKKYLKKLYPNTWNDLYTAFIDRSLDLLHNSGLCGALTSRTFMFLSRLEKVRKKILLSKTEIKTMVDLGHEVLDDAMVETTAYVLENKPIKSNLYQGSYFRLIDSDPESRERIYFSILKSIASEEITESYFYSSNQYAFLSIPSNTLAYWAPKSILLLFERYSHFDSIAEIRPGLTTLDNERFVRFHWEVDHLSIGRNLKWIPFAKGGDYSKYYYDNDLVIFWENDGYELKKFARSKGGSETRFIANQSYYFREGLTYPRVTNKGFNVRYLPANHIFAEKGISIFPKNLSNKWILLGLLNSSLIQYLLLLQTASRSWEKGNVASLPFKIPMNSRIGSLAQNAYELKRAWDIGNEISTRFNKPWLSQIISGDILYENDKLKINSRLFSMKINSKPTIPNTLAQMLDYLESVETVSDYMLQSLQADINKETFNLYEVSTSHQSLIDTELGQLPPELIWQQMEGKSKKEKRREHVRRLLSFFVLQSLKEDNDGVISIANIGGELSVMDHIRGKLEAEFGERRAFQFEKEISEVIGKPIENWLDGDFIQWHTKLYKKRPVIWHLSGSKGTFACFVYYHKLKRETLLSVRTVYLWRLRDSLRAKLKTASEKKNYNEIIKLEEALADIEEFDQALADVIDSGWEPNIDAGVKDNILPLQEAGLLRYKVI